MGISEEKLFEIIDRADQLGLKGSSLDEYLKKEQAKIDSGEYDEDDKQ